MLLILGWFGSVCYLVNHGYISIVKNWNAKIYYSGNLIAAVSLVISSFAISSNQAVFINSFWAIISALLLLNMDIAKLPFSKRVFFVGFAVLLICSSYMGFEYGWTSTIFHNWLGWSSGYVFCLSYLLFCSKKLSPLYYLVLNAYAASALLPVLWGQGNWPVFFLEICWIAISLFGVYTRIESIHLID